MNVRGVRALAAIGAVALSTATMASPASAAGTMLTFSTPGNHVWTVPSGVRAASFDVYGAAGGRGAGGMPGGLGGRALAFGMSVSPGQTLAIVVGGAGEDSASGQFDFGHGGFNGGGNGGGGEVITLRSFGGGGGGGASDVRRAPAALSDRLIVGAGGGGGSLPCTGGAGGGSPLGGGGCAKWSGGFGTDTQAGSSGTLENDLCCSTGYPGDFGSGGRGGPAQLISLAGEAVGGGGGGGGYFGGGGGGGGTHVPNTGFNSIGGGAGGGGGNFLATQLVQSGYSFAAGVRPGNGQVTITYYTPTASASVARAPNAFGWNNTNVDITFTGANPGGPAIGSIIYSTAGSQTTPDTTVTGSSTSVTISAEGSTTASGVARDSWSDDSAPATADVKIDKTPPFIFGTRDLPTNANGWNNTDVTVTWSCNDALSGVQSCSAPTVMNGEGFAQTALGIASDRAENEGLGLVRPINIDKTPPTLSGARDLPPNARGWNNTDVAVIWTCADSLSGVDQCPAPTTVFAEGAGQVVNGTALDRAGNSASASVVSINIDKTPPRLTDCRATDVTGTSAVIRWTTSEPADSQVAYGLGATHGTTTALDASFGTSHAQTLTDLGPGTVYHAQPRSADVADNPATCDDFTFTTTPDTGSGGGDVCMVNCGPDAAATPELDSLLLFGGGFAGLGGYALTRLRARRRQDSAAPE